MWSRRVLCVLIGAWVTAVASGRIPTLQARQDVPAAIAAIAGDLALRHERFEPPGHRPIDLRFFLKPDAGHRGDRVVDVTQAALRLFDEWLGPLSRPALTIVDAPWRSPMVGTAVDGVVVTTTRWLSIERDGGADRGLVAAIARAYWSVDAGAGGWFNDGLARYSAVRAIDTVLQGRQFWSRRYFGGFMPVAIRSMPLSSPQDQGRGRRVSFDEVGRPADARAERAMVAVQTLERYIGWPALQQGLHAYRQQGATDPTVLMTILNAQGARDLSWFFDEALRVDATFDYAVDRFTVEPEGDAFRTRVSLRRIGDGVFAGTSVPRDVMKAHAIPVAIQFAEGPELREWWDGRDERYEIDLTTAAAPRSVEVDPDAMLLLDEVRANNVRRVTPASMPRPLTRAVVDWLVWLQDFMLTSAALS